MKSKNMLAFGQRGYKSMLFVSMTLGPCMCFHDYNKNKNIKDNPPMSVVRQNQWIWLYIQLAVEPNRDELFQVL